MSTGPGNEQARDVPEHVAQYLARRVLADLPESVYETLVSLSPEELAVLERVGGSLQEAEVDPQSWVFVIH